MLVRFVDTTGPDGALSALALAEMDMAPDVGDVVMIASYDNFPSSAPSSNKYLVHARWWAVEPFGTGSLEAKLFVQLVAPSTRV